MHEYMTKLIIDTSYREEFFNNLKELQTVYSEIGDYESYLKITNVASKIKKHISEMSLF